MLYAAVWRRGPRLEGKATHGLGRESAFREGTGFGTRARGQEPPR